MKPWKIDSINFGAMIVTVGLFVILLHSICRDVTWWGWTSVVFAGYLWPYLLGAFAWAGKAWPRILWLIGLAVIGLIGWRFGRLDTGPFVARMIIALVLGFFALRMVLCWSIKKEPIKARAS